MSDALKPCPFCGGVAYLSSYSMDERFAYAAQVSVGCKDCALGFSRCDDQNPKGGYALGGTAQPIVISQWNRRADLPLTTEQIMADPRVQALVGAVSMVFLHGSVQRNCADREFQLPLWVSDELRTALDQLKEPTDG